MTARPRSAEVVIIGAGIMGSSIAYHLAERGMTDVIVFERNLIGQGATADAAGGIRLQFSTETNIQLSSISMDYWEHFEEQFDTFINFRQQGYLFLLTSDVNVESFKANLKLQQRFGVPARWVSVDEIAELNPYLNLDGVLGGTFCPRDGWADTSTSTMGFARAARHLGVQFIEETPVTGFDVDSRQVAGVWCGKHRVSAANVICCAGPQSRDVSRLAGVDIPILPYRRMSWVTDLFDEISPDIPFTIEFEKALYFHPESGGFLFGMSDPHEPSSFDKTVDDDWLFTTVEALVHRAPAFGNATVLNGWAGFYEITPDNNPLLGYVSELDNFIVAAGFSGHGFMQGPAIGKVISELILDGSAASVDIHAFRPNRFEEGDLAQEQNVI